MSKLADTLRAHTGRYLDKRWDWDAFPANRGFAELERAQMRYIGAGGSPKAQDPNTLPPGAFTCSLIYQEPGRKASVHFHQIEELFFVHRGTLTMTWQFGDETVDFHCGPGDAVLNPPGRAHGFRNDGPDDCVMQIMVATAAPMLPTYTDHPADHAVNPLRPMAEERRAGCLAQIEPHVARAARAQRLVQAVDDGTLTVFPYVMQPQDGGQVTPSHFTFAPAELTRGGRTPAYQLDHEEAFMVLDGVLDVELGESGAAATTRLGARDLVLVPAGVPRRIANSDAGPVRFATIVGEVAARPFGWQRAVAATRA